MRSRRSSATSDAQSSGGKARRGWIAPVVLVALAAIVLGGLLGVYNLLRQNDLRTRVERAIEASTGRQVLVHGPISLSVFPTIGFSAADVTVANAPGGRAQSMISARRVIVGVAVAPMMRREVRVTELSLIDPVVALEIDRQGRPNWAINMPKPAKPKGFLSRIPLPRFQPKVSEVRLRNIRIVNGLVTYTDEVSRAAYRIEQVNLRASLDGMDKAFKTDGTVNYRGEKVALSIGLATPRALLAGQDQKLQLEVRSAPANMKFDGILHPGAGGLEGDLAISGPDLRRLAEWNGSPIGAGAGLKNFDVQGKFRFTHNATAFENASIKLDAVQGRGDFLIETSKAKPYLSGRLEVMSLDLNPYLARAVAPPPPTSLAPAGAPRPSAPLLDMENPGWDATPIDLSGLKAINANLELTTGPLIVQKLHFDKSQMNVVLDEGFFVATLNRIELYGGAGTARVQLDARKPPLKMAESLDVDGVRAQAFFADAMGFDALDGAANVTLRIETQGASQKDLVAAMQGDGAFFFKNGVLKGVDLGGVTKTIGNVLTGRLTGPGAKTPFDTLSATLHIADGIAVSRDFHLEAPRFQMKVQGQIDLANQAMDLRFTPRSVSARDKRTGAAIRTGLPMPVRAWGPWAKLQFSTDFTGGGKAAQEAVICRVESAGPGSAC